MMNPYYNNKQNRLDTMHMIMDSLSKDQLKEVIIDLVTGRERPLTEDQLAWIAEKRAWCEAQDAREAKK